MFNLFNKKTNIQKLDAEYRKLLAEAHKLSTVNRKLSDSKIVEANEIAKQI
ncbi:MAG: Lacal_2735 family protein, partial [Cyclobacteriaceae bacterium]